MSGSPLLAGALHPTGGAARASAPGGAARPVRAAARAGGRAPWPARVAFLTVGALLAGGAGRLVYIERTRGEELRERARSQQSAFLIVPAQRGSILDARGRVLAGSVRRPSIFADPTLIRDCRYAAHTLAPILGLDGRELERQLADAGGRRFVWVKRQISDAELRAFEAVRAARGLTGFVVRYEPQREYLHGRLASHVLGFVGAEQTGLAGIEQSFDTALRGSDGRQVWTVDTRRNRVESRPEEFTAPRDGSSVVLTIDAYIQARTEHHLSAAVSRYKAAWGSAVVLDPLTGEVLAMAVIPDFDPAHPLPPVGEGAELEAARQRLINRAVAGAYEPGSMFKPFIASCALEDRLTRFGEVFAINGPTRSFGSRTISDTHAYGSLVFEEVISKSSNIGMGLIGARCGNARLHAYVRRFGFGDLTGIDLPGEHAGLVQDFSRWNSYSTQSVPIGQEIAITPIQLATAFSVFCNGGILLRPRIVRGVIDANGEVQEDRSTPIAVRRVLDEQTAEAIRTGPLVDVCVSGTARTTGNIPDYQTFGKTGTAQIAIPGRRGYLGGQYMGSFIGGAPSDHPRVVATVSIYRPSSGQYYGGTVAAPAVASILADALAYLREPPQAMVKKPSGVPRGSERD